MLPEPIQRMRVSLETALGIPVPLRPMSEAPEALQLSRAAHPALLVWSPDGPEVYWNEQDPDHVAHELMHALLALRGFPGAQAIARLDRSNPPPHEIATWLAGIGHHHIVHKAVVAAGYADTYILEHSEKGVLNHRIAPPSARRGQLMLLMLVLSDLMVTYGRAAIAERIIPVLSDRDTEAVELFQDFAALLTAANYEKVVSMRELIVGIMRLIKTKLEIDLTNDFAIRPVPLSKQMLELEARQLFRLPLYRGLHGDVGCMVLFKVDSVPIAHIAFPDESSARAALGDALLQPVRGFLASLRQFFPGRRPLPPVVVV